MYTCSRCKRTLPLSAFHKSNTSKRGHRVECKECYNRIVRDYNRANPGRKKATAKLYYLANRDSIRAKTKARYEANKPHILATQRDYWLRSNYGIGQDEYDELLQIQDGKCGICGSAEPGGKAAFFGVDHDHVTGQVRGLLCRLCNSGIGLLADDPERIERALAWVNGKNPIQSAQGKDGNIPPSVLSG